MFKSDLYILQIPAINDLEEEKLNKSYNVFGNPKVVIAFPKYVMLFLNIEGSTHPIGKLRYSVFLVQDLAFCFFSKSTMISSNIYNRWSHQTYGSGIVNNANKILPLLPYFLFLVGNRSKLGALMIDCICVIAASFSRTIRSSRLNPLRINSALMASRLESTSNCSVVA